LGGAEEVLDCQGEYGRWGHGIEEMGLTRGGGIAAVAGEYVNAWV